MSKPRDKNKIKLVAKEYVNNGLNMTKALKTIEGEGNYKHENSICVKASRWRNSIDIQDEIRKELAKLDKTIVNDTYCILNLAEIINDKSVKASDRVNAVNVLAKVIGASKEGQIQNNIVFADYMKDLQSITVKSVSKDTSIVSSNVPINNTIDITPSNT